MPDAAWWAELEAIFQEYGHWESVMESLRERGDDATEL
jgi:hypothetical protein